MTTPRRLLVTTTISCAVLLGSSPLSAQPLAGHQRDRARTFLVVRLAEALDLSDDKALQLSAIIRKSDEQRVQLRQQRSDAETKLRDGLTKTPVDQAAMSKLITEVNDIDQRLALLPEQSFRETQKILTVEQQAKLVLVRPELQNQIRRAVRRRFEAMERRPEASSQDE